ncbi:MAG: hypothetical protein NTW50_00855 [Candidatus Berkelbacteria bacterium]|nr:hypothetical protein [Candidatus Berkelbacteria bacterium]
MERERITISIKKDLLNQIDQIIDGVSVRNRSHAFETLALKSLGSHSRHAIILLGGDNATKAVPATISFLNMLAENGFDKVTLALGFLGNKIKSQLSNEKIKIKYDFLEESNGSGGALLNLKKDLKDTFIVFNSTEKLKISLDQLLEFHRKHQSIATIATTDLESMEGVYVFEPSVFKYIPEGFSLLEENTLPQIIKDGEAVVMPLEII